MNKRRWKGVGMVLTRSLAAMILPAATPAKANDVDRWRPLVEEASTRFGIPTSWIERVIRAESRGHTMLNGRPIRSRAGAIGLMQLMPSTWADMRSRLALGNDPDDPRDNISAGTFYLRLLYDRFGYPGLFGAYNAGPGTYEAYLAGRRRLPSETVAYLQTVGEGSAPSSPAAQWVSPAASPVARSAPLPSLFVVRRTPPEVGLSEASDESQSSLFALRKLVP